MQRKEYTTINITLIIVIVLVIILFISVGLLIHFYDFTSIKAGTLGDAFNGLTAPFIALLSAGLLYYSFMAQLRANEMLQGQWTFDTYLKMFQDISGSFHNITAERGLLPGMEQEPEIYNGRQLFEILIQGRHLKGGVQAVTDLEIILEELHFLIDNVNSSILDQKRYIGYKIIRFHQIQIQDVTIKLIEKFKKDGNELKKASFIIIANIVQKQVIDLQNQI